MNTLQVGFARVNITPPLGIGIAGSWRKRPAEGVLDELEVNCLCLACGDTKVAMLAVDHVGIQQDILNKVRKDIEMPPAFLQMLFISTAPTPTPVLL